MAQKLNQVIAIEKPIKKRVNENITGQYHLGQKGEPFAGFTRAYAAKDAEGEKLPPEGKLVQVTVRGIIKAVQKDVAELFDVTATKDFANCEAKADVVVDGTPILKDAPVTFLLFAEKYITDIRTIVSKLPVLSADENWTKDTNTDLYKSDPVQSLRSQKLQRPLVLYPATDKHPAQTQVINEDVTVGTWTTTKLSGAMPVPDKDALLERIEVLLKAVKYAREQANMIEATQVNAGAALLGWLFAHGGAPA